MPIMIVSPLPGTFYRCPAPGQPPFQEIGSLVAVGDVVGLIEVMKTFNQVVAEQAGRVVRFLIENEDEVTAGQTLLELEA